MAAQPSRNIPNTGTTTREILAVAIRQERAIAPAKDKTAHMSNPMGSA